MTQNDEFADRLARINSKNVQPRRPAPGSPKGGGNGRRGGGLLLRIVLPLVFAGALGFVFYEEIPENVPAGVLTSDNMLAASVRARMTDDEIKAMENDPWINKELKSRNYSDPDMARLLLSH